MRESFVLEGITVKPGQEQVVNIELPNFYHTPITIPVRVIHGKKPGPTAFITAAIHGDELNGVEIIRRLRKINLLKRLRGTLLLIPIVNVYGVMTLSRYLPDRRDLNRSFPGSRKGSLAARVAQLLYSKVISMADFGVDLHTGAVHRSNLPQVRVNTKHEFSLKLAKEFEAPVILHSDLRDGSLRQVADENEIPIILYEAGEALRFDEKSIRIGVKGIVNILRCEKMIPESTTRKKGLRQSIITTKSRWVRAPQSGLIRTVKNLGEAIEKNDVIAFVDDPLTDETVEIRAPLQGIIIGKTQLPLIQEGDAVFHMAYFKNLEKAEEDVGYLADEMVMEQEFSELESEARIE